MRFICTAIALILTGCSAGGTAAPAMDDAAPAQTRSSGRGGHGHGMMMGGGHQHRMMAGSGADGERGREIFLGRGNCASCHGSDGAGTALAPDLTDDAWLHGDGSLMGIRRIVMHGVARPIEHPAPMPARGGASLSMQEVHDVAAYVAGLND